MNESELEKQLQSLRPVHPTHGLEERVAIELAQATRSSPASSGVIEKKSWLERLLPALGWGTAGAALGIVAMLSLNLAGAGPKSTTSLPPASATTASTTASDDSDVEKQIVTMQDEGIITSASGPARVVRYTSLERRSWTDASSGAITFVEIPREDVVLLPVNIQ